MSLPVCLASLAIVATGQLGTSPASSTPSAQCVVDRQASGPPDVGGRHETAGPAGTQGTPGRHQVISVTAATKSIHSQAPPAAFAVEVAGGDTPDKRLVWVGALLFGALGAGSTIWLHLRVRPDLLTPDNAAEMYDDAAQPGETPPA